MAHLTKRTGLNGAVNVTPKQIKSAVALEKAREIITKLFKEKKIQPLND